jgi:hypothetical protein
MKEKNKQDSNKKKNKIIEIRKHLSIITLNVTSLNYPITTHRFTDWIKKIKIQLFVVYKRHTSQAKIHTE